MVNREIFAQHMTALCDRFNRTLSPPAMAIYYELLADRLNDAEFKVAIRLAFNGQFFPSPDEIIACAHPVRDRKLQAADEYDRVLRACGAYSWQRALDREDFPDTTRKAIGAAGGIRVMALAEPADEPHIRRRFIEYYVAHVEHDERQGRALSLGEMDPRAAAIVSGLTKRVGQPKTTEPGHDD